MRLRRLVVLAPLIALFTLTVVNAADGSTITGTQFETGIVSLAPAASHPAPMSARLQFALSAMYLNGFGVGIGVAYKLPNGLTILPQVLFVRDEGDDAFATIGGSRNWPTRQVPVETDEESRAGVQVTLLF